MTHVALIKTPGGWANADPETEEFHSKIKLGQTIHADFKRMRNAAFHRKLFSLFALAFEYWDPGEIDTRWGRPEKHFNTFRKNITILAGHGYPVFNIDGTFKMEADSLSFGNMEQDVFDKLYQAVLTVVMKRIPVLSKMTAEEIDDLTNKFLEFA